MRLLLFLLPILSLGSCVEVSGHEQVLEVDTLIIRLDSLETNSRELKLENLSEIKTWSDTLDLRIRKLFRPVPFIVGKQIVEFSELTDALTIFSSADTLISNRLIIQKSQLVNLKTDISNGSGKRALYDANIEAEQMNVSQIEELINIRDSARTRIITNFNALRSNLDSNLNVILLNE